MRFDLYINVCRGIFRAQPTSVVEVPSKNHKNVLLHMPD